MVEFVSANPTGPMHMGNARGGATGGLPGQRAGCRGLRCTGGNSMSTTRATRSKNSAFPWRPAICSFIWARKQWNFPEDAYHGDDIKEHAAALCRPLRRQVRRRLLRAERRKALVDYALPLNIEKMQAGSGQIPHRLRRVVPGIHPAPKTARCGRCIGPAGPNGA